MKRIVVKGCLLLLLVSWTGTSWAQQTKTVAVESGVSHDLAVYRKRAISDIQYTLEFMVPTQKTQQIAGSETIDFNLRSPAQTLQVDCKLLPADIKTIAVNDASIAVDLQKEHLLINKKYLRVGRNKIAVAFTAGNASLNHNEDYLYALFVPDHARTVFPCFDQPDLKARFLLSLRVPAGWKVLANADKKDS